MFENNDTYLTPNLTFYEQMGNLLDQSTPHELTISHSSLKGMPHYNFEIKALSFWERASRFIGCGKANTATIDSLKKLIGEKRFERILLKKELGLQKFVNSNKLYLTNEVVHKIFIGLADVRIEDLRDQVGSVYGNQYTVEQTGTGGIDLIYKELFPFDAIKDIFNKHCQPVSYLDKAQTSGKGFQGLQERTWAILNARNTFLTEENQLKRQATEAELLTSRLGDREPTPGTIIRLDSAYFEVKKSFAKGGAHATILQSLNRKHETLLVCRGTATRKNAASGMLSGLNDLTKEIGLYGITSIWPDLKEYLIKWAIPDIKWGSRDITIYGKSLGGAHAQYLTTLIAGTTNIKVKALTTFASIGVPKIVNETFTKTLQEKKLEIPIHIFRNSGLEKNHEIDYIPTVGGVHINNSNTRVYYVTPQNEMEHDAPSSPSIPRIEGIFSTIKKLIISFGHGHIRQNTLTPAFQVHKIAKEKLEEELTMGERNEPLRMTVAKVFNCITFGLFNRTTFQTFYNK